MSTRRFDEWRQRGLVHSATASGVEEALDGPPLSGYIGFDPTAPSLHVGNLLPITLLMRLQRAGHRPIALVGGGTGLIGDPSGKEEERKMLDRATLEENRDALGKQLERFLDFSPGGALLVDNARWLEKLELVGFLRDVGKHFSVNSMIARESVKRRLESREHGISFTEFAYSLLQAYDYLELYDREGCTLQMGGSDQWGNIVAGADLIRRKRDGRVVHGLTAPLVTRADGRKFGKTEEGNVWLDAELTTPYEMYQFWLNTGDDDAVPYLKSFTFLPLAEIEEIAAELARRPEKRAAQRRLAQELTRLVHGDEALRRAEHVTRVLFAGGDLRELSAEEVRDGFRAVPSSAFGADQLARGLALTEALKNSGLASSKGRARTDIGAGAVFVNNLRITDPQHALGESDLIGGAFILLRRGKKTYHLLRRE